MRGVRPQRLKRVVLAPERTAKLDIAPALVAVAAAATARGPAKALRACGLASWVKYMFLSCTFFNLPFPQEEGICV